MSQNPRPNPGLFTQVEITAGAGYPRASEKTIGGDESTQVLRHILSALDRNNELLEEMLTQMSAMHKQRNSELSQWKQANPDLSEACRVAAEALSKAQIEYLNTITQEVSENADVLTEGEFMLNEFVDRFGPRLAHLNGVMQVLAQLAGPGVQNTNPAPQ